MAGVVSLMVCGSKPVQVELALTVACRVDSGPLPRCPPVTETASRTCGLCVLGQQEGLASAFACHRTSSASCLSSGTLMLRILKQYSVHTPACFSRAASSGTWTEAWMPAAAFPHRQGSPALLHAGARQLTATTEYEAVAMALP